MGILDKLKETLPCDKFVEDDLWRVDCEAGATKAVFIPADEDKVYKVPFTGQEIYGEYEDFRYVGVNSIDYNGSSWNYCEYEQWLYERAKDAGIEVLFAENIFIDEINTQKVYTQQKCCAFYDYESERTPSAEAKKSASNLDVCDLELLWVADVIDTYGEKIAKDLIAFIEEFCLGDFHGGNYGYRECDGKPIIFDYANFND